MKYLIIFLTLTSVNLAAGNVKVEIIKASGDVKIRRGMEEDWKPAAAGAVLETIDSILTGEGEATLELSDGRKFELKSQTILDIADLRLITEEELFLMIMSDKIQSMPRKQDKNRLQIGDVNVVHGVSQQESYDTTRPDSRRVNWEMEKNGAVALYRQDFTPNAILKINTILSKYPEIEDCGELHFFLGGAFEKLAKNGQAIDAYKMVIDRSCDTTESLQLKEAAQTAIAKLER